MDIKELSKLLDEKINPILLKLDIIELKIDILTWQVIQAR